MNIILGALRATRSSSVQPTHPFCSDFPYFTEWHGPRRERQRQGSSYLSPSHPIQPKERKEGSKKGRKEGPSTYLSIWSSLHSDGTHYHPLSVQCPLLSSTQSHLTQAMKRVWRLATDDELRRLDCIAVKRECDRRTEPSYARTCLVRSYSVTPSLLVYYVCSHRNGAGKRIE